MSGALVLIGLSGSGKSTTGSLAAAQLGLRFIDTDRVVEAGASVPVATIFREQGEAVFRALERHAVREACAAPAVVATGGGAILLEENRLEMRRDNFVVWLDPPLSLLAARLERHVQGEERPLLAGDVEQRLVDLYTARRALYAATAVYHVSGARCARTGVRQLAGELADAYRRWQQERGGAAKSEGADERGLQTGI
jgi:shikimate kinase